MENHLLVIIIIVALISNLQGFRHHLNFNKVESSIILSSGRRDSCNNIEISGESQIRTNIFNAVKSVLVSSATLLTAGRASHQLAVAETIDQDVQLSASKFASELENTRELNSDEFIVEFSGNGSLGLKLVESFPKGFPVVTVKQITDDSLQQQHPELEIGAIVIAVGDTKVDGTPLTQIASLVKSSDRPIKIKFRDPSRFFKLLDSTDGAPKRIVTSSYLPANTRDAGAPEQIIKVERLEMPPPASRIRAAQYLDVMEIQYVAQVQSDINGTIVDSSAERSAPGTSSRSIYYVLGQQNGPPGKFPPGWDLTLRGMVPGEKRRIVLPYTLAYDRKGDKLRGIPPFASMVYTVRLLSLT